MKSLFIALSFLTLLFLASQSALACSCATIGTLEDRVKWQLKNGENAIFSGEVVTINAVPATRDVAVKIKVEEVWKGGLSKEIVLTTPKSSGACGSNFQPGANYLIFTYGNDGKNLSTGLCTLTSPLGNADEILKLLGKGTTVQERKIPDKSLKCPIIEIIPPDFTSFNQNTWTYSVSLENLAPDTKPTYQWTVRYGAVEGKIALGQGTPSIEIESRDLEKGINTAVEIKGLHEGCLNKTAAFFII